MTTANKMRLGYTNVTPATRSRMQAVRCRNTDPEMRVRRVLHALGYRFRLHRKSLPGTPDIVLPGRRKIILVHGCFWHGHPQCKRAKLPAKNTETWRAKIQENQARDENNIAILREQGWDVMIIWECETRNPSLITDRLRRFLL